MDAYRYSIMIIDDNVTNLTVAKQALANDYRVYPVISGEKALALLEKVHPDLILLDIQMPGLNGFDVLNIVKANDKMQDIPIIFLTSMDSQGNELEGLQLGAVDFITKPFSPPLLLQRIKIHIDLYNHTHHLERLVEEKTKVIKELQSAILHTITDLIERRDDSTGNHVARTQLFVKAMLETVVNEEFYQKEIKDIDINMAIEVTQLHDVGKIGIPDHILLKPGKLSDEEYEIMKQHVSIGEDAIRNAMNLTSEKKFLEYSEMVVTYHHEKWDGTGYPRGIKGSDIPLLGRIMAIADVYDALTSARVYKEPLSHDKAVEIIKDGAGVHFDPQLITIFLKIEPVFKEISQ